MTGHIHPSAVVDPAAEIDEFRCHRSVQRDRSAGVRIGAGTEIGAHCIIDGVMAIGRDNRSTGSAPSAACRRTKNTRASRPG